MTIKTDLRMEMPPANYSVEQIVKNRSHLYVAKLDDGSTREGSGVTGVLGIIAKPALIPWATKTALLSAENAWLAKLDGKKKKKVELTEAFIKSVTEEAKKKPDSVKDAAADLGTQAHAYFDAFIRGEQPDLIAEPLKPAVDAFNSWVKESKISIVQGDTKVFSLIYNYGGALDAIGVNEEGEFVLLDWKTSSGCYPEMALQVSAYVQAFDETYGIEIKKAVIVRFSKVAPVEFEAKEVLDLKNSFSAFLAAKNLQERMKKDHFKGE